VSPRESIPAAGRRILQWRLLLIWVLALLVPTLVVQVPLSGWLGELLDLSPRADEIARRFDMLAFEDVTYALGRSGGAFTGAASVAGLLALLLSPFLAGLMVTAARHTERPLRVVPLLSGGLALYFRMLRLWLVSLVPLAAVGGLASVAFNLASKRSEQAILESQADRGMHLALAGTVVLFLLARATIEAGRAQMAADEQLRSGWRAWLRGVRLTFRRPVAVLGRYLLLTALALVLAAPILSLRLHLPGATAPLYWLGFLLTQLAVAALGWARATRLASLVSLLRTPR
jgi:hypothetical protein